ncbi:hypothetical protein FRB90_011712 [Tulasnella sp. 427]|nr:hypothetical protein FRB90_011712 [Tulasnella sp. 427]
MKAIMTSSASAPVFSTVAAAATNNARRLKRVPSKTTLSSGVVSGLSIGGSVVSQRKGATSTRRPLAVISTVNLSIGNNSIANGSLLPSIASSLEQIQQQDVDAWFADVKKRAILSSTPSGSDVDHKEEMLSSLKKAIKLVSQTQELRLELSSECNALVRSLRTIVRLLDANYTNEDWYEKHPPNAINQTLRRLKNSLQNVARSPSTVILPAAQVTEFTQKFQFIAKSMVTPA